MAMHVEVFRHRVDPDFQGEFDELYARMVTVVKGLKGYMSHKVFTAEDGEKVLIGYFEDFEAIEEWDVHPEHKYAKDRGKNGVFFFFFLVVDGVGEHLAMNFIGA